MKGKTHAKIGNRRGRPGYRTPSRFLVREAEKRYHHRNPKMKLPHKGASGRPSY